jgi:hypothetical protein
MFSITFLHSDGSNQSISRYFQHQPPKCNQQKQLLRQFKKKSSVSNPLIYLRSSLEIASAKKIVEFLHDASWKQTKNGRKKISTQPEKQKNAAEKNVLG